MNKNNWPTKKLGEICKIIAGQAPPSKYYNDEGKGIPFLTVNSFGNIYPKVERWTIKCLRESKESDVLFSVSGSLGLVNLGINACITRSIFALRPLKNFILQKFLFYTLKKYGSQIALMGSGTAQKVITINQISEFEIPLPPLHIQQKIVKILDTIQSAVEIQEKIIEKTKELKKSLMAELFKYGSPSFRKGRKLKKTGIGEIPEDWEVVKIKDVVLDIEQNDPSKTPLQEIKYIDVSSISNEFLKIVEYKSYLGKDAPSRARKILKENDIVFATVRPYLKRIAFVPKEYDGFYGSTAFCVLRSNPEKILPYFLFYYVSTDIFVSKVSGYQTGSGYPAITDDHIENELIHLPSLPEQQEIAEILQTIDQKIEIEKKKKELYEELFKTMLNKIMNQEIDVEKIEV
jgi:type I restriction enzyme S subunit